MPAKRGGLRKNLLEGIGRACQKSANSCNMRFQLFLPILISAYSMTRFITHFESAIDPSVSLPADCEQTMHENRPLWSRYDLDGVRQSMTKEALKQRPQDMWRYRELLPIGDENRCH